MFEEIYDEDAYKVHGYTHGELMLDITVDEDDLKDERPMAINPQYHKNEQEITEEDFRLEMSDVIKLYKFSDYDGIVFGRYVRDFPMDEDVFISLVEEEADSIFNNFIFWLDLDLMFIDIDFDGIPELFNYCVSMGARPFYAHKCINFSKGEKIRYDIYVNEINTYDFRSLYVDSIFLKENANGEKKFYIEYDYGIIGINGYSCNGIFGMDIEEDTKTEKPSIICSPIAQVIEYHNADNTIKYEVLDEKTGKLIETNEAKYNKFAEEFKSNGCIDYLKTNVHYDHDYFIYDRALGTYDPEQVKLVKDSIINAAEEYIELYKISEYTDPLEIEFDKQKFIDSMEKATEYFIENFEVPPLWCFLMDITSDGMFTFFDMAVKLFLP